MPSYLKESPFHSDSELSDRTGCRGSILWTTESERIISCNVNRDAAAVVGYLKMVSIKLCTNPKTLEITVPSESSCAIH